MHYQRRQKVCSQSGLTIVELMIAISILLIAITLGFNFIFFGVQAFGTGEQRTLVQYNVRLASRVITDELRYADQVEIYAVIPPHTPLMRAIYLKENGQVVIRDETGTERQISGQLSSEVNFNQLLFSVNPDNHKMLIFAIAAERDGEQQYQLESEVAPLNQRRSIFNHAGEATGIAVAYTVLPSSDLPTLLISPLLVISEGVSQSETFTLSLINEKFVDLDPFKIALSGPAFNNPDDFSISIVEGSITETAVDISISGNYQLGSGTFTVYSSALEGNYDLYADIEVIPNLVYINDAFLPAGTVGEAYAHQLSVTGGSEPYQFYIGELCDIDNNCVQTTLPGGLSINTSTGEIHGGHLLGPAGDYAVVIGVTDDEGESHEREYLLKIENKQYNLTVGSIGPGTTEPIMGNYNYDYGQEVTVIAIPAEGAIFKEWTGIDDGCVIVSDGVTNTVTVTITKDYFIRADFIYTYTPLNQIAGGSFVMDSDGNYFIKLTGNHNRVLNYHAEATAKKYNQLNASEIAALPTLDELSGDLWDDARRMEPTNKAYWTRTETDNNNIYYYVNTNGSINTAQQSTDLYLRKIQVLDGAFVEENAGTYENPHIIQ